MGLLEINKRYTELSATGCCLTRGGAVNYAQAQFNEVCVDLGSGHGTDVFRLAEEVGKDGFVYGIDISDDMIENGQKGAESLGISNVSFLKSTFGKIGLKDEVAHLVISNCSINQTFDKQAVWNEIFRILKKGGRFVVSDTYSVSTIPHEFKYKPETNADCPIASITRDEYLKNLESAGFSTIAILEESAPYNQGNINVVSWTITGQKPVGECSWCN